MTNIPEKKSRSQTKSRRKPFVVDAKAAQAKPAWYQVFDLIVGLDADPTFKLFLIQVYRHTNSTKAYAWAAQSTLARKMGVSIPTVERAFKHGKKLGILCVRRVRTGKGQADQFNQYWLDLNRLGALQRPPEPGSLQLSADGENPSPGSPFPSSVPPVQVKHPSPMMGASERSTHLPPPEQPSLEVRAPITHDGEGLDVNHIQSKACVENLGASASVLDSGSGRSLLKREKKSSSSHSTDATDSPDDDDDQNLSFNPQNLRNPEFLSWKRIRISARVQKLSKKPTNPNAYMHTAETNFDVNITNEIGQYLEEVAIEAMEIAMRAAYHAAKDGQAKFCVHVAPVREALSQVITKHKLPCDSTAAIQTAVHAAEYQAKNRVEELLRSIEQRARQRRTEVEMKAREQLKQEILAEEIATEMSGCGILTMKLETERDPLIIERYRIMLPFFERRAREAEEQHEKEERDKVAARSRAYNDAYRAELRRVNPQTPEEQKAFCKKWKEDHPLGSDDPKFNATAA